MSRQYLKTVTTSALFLAASVYPAMAQESPQSQTPSAGSQMERPAQSGDEHGRSGQPGMQGERGRHGNQSDRAMTGDNEYARDDSKAIFGTVKEYEAGKKIEIDVPNSLDKEYDLTATDKTVQLPNDIKVGDRVKIFESDSEGGRETVMISRASASEFQSSDASASADEGEGTVGTVKEFEEGKKLVVDIRMRPDKEYDLSSSDKTFNLSSDIKVGDRVKIVEREEGDRELVTISRLGESHSPFGSAAGDASAAAGDQAHYARVKSYEAGKKIELEMQNGQTREFDLSESTAVNVPANIKVGDRVKMTQRTVGGSPTIVLEPANEGGFGQSGDAQGQGSWGSQDKQHDKSGRHDDSSSQPDKPDNQ